MYYIIALAAACIVLIAASFLSGLGAFLCWFISTVLFVLICYALDAAKKEEAINMLGVFWLSLTFSFGVCAFFVWGIAGDLSWILKP